jgi:hypothetical protein
MKNREMFMLLFVVTILWCFGTVARGTVYDVNDPTGLESLVNSAGRSISQQVGNFTIAQFNAHPNRLVITADEQNGYAIDPLMDSDLDPDQLHNVNLTQGISGVDLTVTFDIPRISNEDQNSIGFGRTVTEWWASGQDVSTSAAWCMVYATQGSSKIIFNKDVYGTGFTLNRTQADCTVELFDANNIRIGQVYTVAANSPSSVGHSFFGYYNHKKAQVRSVKFSLGGVTNQFAIDDITVVTSIAGLPPCYSIALPGDFNQDCYVNFADFALMSANWLKCNDPIRGSECLD